MDFPLSIYHEIIYNILNNYPLLKLIIFYAEKLLNFYTVKYVLT